MVKRMANISLSSRPLLLCELNHYPIGGNMKNLIRLVKGHPVVSSLVIAEEFGRRHDNVIQTIRSLIESKHLGALEFKETSYIDKWNRKQISIELNEKGFLIAMPFIGGKKSKDGQVRLVESFLEMRSQLEQLKQSREIAKEEYRPMTDAIKFDREVQGKDIKPYHFSNEADLINRIALGMTSAKFKVFHEIDKKQSIRDYLTPYQLKCVADLQRANTTYILDQISFEDRKKKLTDRYRRLHLLPLTNEVHGISA